MSETVDRPAKGVLTVEKLAREIAAAPQADHDQVIALSTLVKKNASDFAAAVVSSAGKKRQE